MIVAKQSKHESPTCNIYKPLVQKGRGDLKKKKKKKRGSEMSASRAATARRRGNKHIVRWGTIRGEINPANFW